MEDDNEKKGDKMEELFMVPRRWEDLDLSEKAKIEREGGSFAGLPENQRAYAERIFKMARKHYLNED